MSGTLDGQVVLITGTSGGIGRAAVLALAAEGARVVGVSRTPDHDDALAQAVAARGSTYLHLAGDARRAEVAKEAVRLCLERFGRIDILVNNAARWYFSALVDQQEENYDKVMNLNIKAMYFMTQAA
ncbi:MAG: SDR family oxidoreductase, partial [Propionibacteriaceae bacterium]|nr:SDR family oxidoreductase [Propionibacteriaceae bacterium]